MRHDGRIGRAALATGIVVISSLLPVAATAATRGRAPAPAPEAAAEGVASVATGSEHACAMTTAGRVRCWGVNTYGVLGTGDLRQPVGDAPGELPDALVTVDLGAGRTATALDAGGATTCAVRDDGAVECWGANDQGQLARGDTARRGWLPTHLGDNGLVDLGAGRTATSVAVGEQHACALLDGGDVRCWGDNGEGQLGIGDDADRGDEQDEVGDALPTVDLGADRTATSIVAGVGFTCALLDDGRVACWGDGDSGRTGIGTTVDRGDDPGEMGGALLTVDLGAGRTATAIAAGQRHACAVLDDGLVRCWGDNSSGQLGVGDTVDRGGAAGEPGEAVPPVDLGTGRTAVDVTAGALHTCALLDDASVRCWGEGTSGRLGIGDTTDRGVAPGQLGDALPTVDLGTDRSAVALSAGYGFTCAALDDGSAKCWGDNPYGTLGQGDTLARGDERFELGDDLPAIELGLQGPHVAATQTADRTALVAGRTVHFSIRVRNTGDTTLTGVTVDAPASPACEQPVPALAAGEEHVIDCDRLTTGADAGRLTNSVSVDTDQTGPVHANPARVTVQPYPNEPPASRVALGTSHSCALLTTGDVTCWGANNVGQLGQEDTVARGDQPGELGDAVPRIDLGTGRTATALAAAGNHTCALLDDGRVKCWGKNDVGQLGLGDTFAHGYNAGQMGDALPAVDLGEGRTAVAITAGAQGWYQPNIGYTCALLDDGSVKCWGENRYGQLGQGTTTPSLGGQPGQMAALEPIDLGPGRTALAVDAGANFACALRDTHDVVCWGETDGVNTTPQHDVDDHIGDDPGEMGSALVPVNLGPGHTATALSVSSTHACAVRDDEALICWGANDQGQLGIGTNQAAGRSQPLPDDHPPVDLGTGRTVQRLATGGYHHTCALLDDATVRCWGAAGRGTLGTGDDQNRGDGPGEMGDLLLPVDLGPGRTAIDVALGDFHVCAVLDDGTVKCWGENDLGQLGVGDTFDRGDEPGELGDQLAVVDLGTPPDAPALAVALSAGQASVEAGETVDYEVTVTNTGNVDLTGVAVTDADVPECAATIGVLPAGNTATVDCSYATSAADAGTFRHVATADSDQTDPVDSPPVDVVVTLTHQPDLALKRSGQAFVGGDAYGTDGAAQSVGVTRRPGGRATFYVRIENDGAVADTFDLRRVGTSPGLSVRYYRGRTATDLTAAVVGRTYRTRTLAPGASVLVRVEVTASAGAAPGERTVTLRSRSDAEATRLDTVQARLVVV